RSEATPMRRFIAFGPAFVVLLAAAVVVVAVPAAVYRIGAANTRATITLAQQSLDQDDVLDRLNKAVRNIGLAVEPSVVHIEVFGRGDGGFMGSSGSG